MAKKAPVRKQAESKSKVVKATSKPKAVVTKARKVSVVKAAKTVAPTSSSDFMKAAWARRNR
jgi:hypothetical protein